MSMNPIKPMTRTERVQRTLARHEALIIFVIGIVIGFVLSRV